MRISQIALSALLCTAPALASAEVELSFYGGWQEANPSTVTFAGTEVTTDAGDLDGSYITNWEGHSFTMPPYWGVRATWWRESDIGFGLDFIHAKTYADDAMLTAAGLEHFEFSDGLNILTFNAYRRWNNAFGNLTPYVGGGIGISIPHAEVVTSGADGETLTWGYQYGGPAVTWLAGVSYPISDSWSVFGEYKGTWSQNEVSLDDGGTLSTDIVTNALNVGVSFSF